ncbi:MAG: ATP-binding protein [Deltaproteobacteria bacterium]|nr:ATP-binding protein [Deltaproteobacteria bacterium]
MVHDWKGRVGLERLGPERHAADLRLRLMWGWKKHVEIEREVGAELRELRAEPLDDELASFAKRLGWDRLDTEIVCFIATLEREAELGLQIGELVGQLGRTSPSPALIGLAFSETERSEIAMGRVAPWSRLVDAGWLELEGSGHWSERRLSLSASISAALFETPSLPDLLRGLSWVVNQAELPLPRVAEPVLAAAREALTGNARLVFEGPPGAGRKQLARELTGKPILVCELHRMTGDERNFDDLVRATLSEAWLRDAVAYFDLGPASDANGARIGEDKEAPSGSAKLRPSPRERRILDHILREHARPVCLGVSAGDQGLLPGGRAATRIPVVAADIALQAEAWKSASDALGEAIDGPVFARRFPLSLRALRRIAATVDERRRGGQPVSGELVESQAREHLRQETGLLAKPITTALTWEDLVLPPTLVTDMREVIALLRTRDRMLDAHDMRRWGRGGFHLLLAGEPGTGKTTIATLLGRELGRETLQVNLDQVFSRYVGETEKHLVQVFQLAERSRSLLLLDEADALLAKRTDVKDANDRFGNLAVNVVLQLMETYDIVSVATTNRDSGLDEASLRRFAYRFTVPPPDVDERNMLFEKMQPRGVRIDPAIDWYWFAEQTQVSGGLIRNIMMRMAGLAAANNDELTLDIALRSVNRELKQLGRLPLRVPHPH